jgi:DNA-binding transcriptional regulator YdaS (Cro superfamily)
METQTPLQKAIEIAGGQSALARECSVAQAHVWHWLHRANSRVPAEHCIAIEKATGGRVTRHDLRPDIYPDEPVAACSSHGGATQ